MQAELIRDIGRDPLFLELSRKRRKAKIIMVSIMMLVFLTTQIIWAFFPAFVSMRIPSGSSVSLAVWFTVIVVLTAIILSGYYSLVMGKQLDKLNEDLLRKYEGENNDQ